MKSLVGLPVKTASGQSVGVVTDVCIDPEKLRLVAVLLSRSGLLRSNQMVYWQDLSRTDPTELQIDSTHALYPISEVPDSWWSSDREPGLWGRELHDPSGALIGLIADLLIDQTGRITGCTVSDGVLKDLVDGRPEMVAQLRASADGGGLIVVTFPEQQE